MADCCAALHAAHEVRADDGSLIRLVHCDVSPQNIMITTEGVLKLVDFGVARAAAGAKASDFPQIDGKAAYMAPEHAAGKRISRLSDVFTLGICLYEITTAQRPFATGNREATIGATIVSPGTYCRSFPPLSSASCFARWRWSRRIASLRHCACAPR
jgi:eukaryotic-like serine/threonine-protein kinase